MPLHVGWVAMVCLAVKLVAFSKKPFMSSLHGKHVFLTGASSGIGLAMVEQALQQGAYLTLIARSAEKMKQIAESLLKKLDLPADRLLVKVRSDNSHLHRARVTKIDVT